MALTHLLLVGTALLSLAFFSGSEAGDVGVCYGMRARNLIQPPAVVQLLQNNGITKVRLYDPDAGALSALANSGIKVRVSLPNENLVDAAGSTSYALRWVQSNVMAYPGTLIDSVDVGNEVFHQAPQLTAQLLPAMKNIQAALASVGLADAVKVFTPIALDALKEPSWPPSGAEFRDDLAQSVMGPMIDFLDQTGSHLSFNIYPYFAYKQHPDTVDLNYVLFLPNKGNFDNGTGLTYFNMFDAMLDAVFHAEEKLRNSRGRPSRGRMLADGATTTTVDESGHPAAASTVRAASDDLAGQKSVRAASTADAETYNSNLISKVLRGTGTPYRPNAVINVYIFSLFNEDLKPGDDDEHHFGLFHPDGTPVYKVDFGHPGPPPGPGGASWCVANPAVGENRLQDALDFACGQGPGQGMVDCTAIKPGGSCFNPDTRVAHASYAFDAYYQKHGRTDQSCDFGGCGSVVHQQPSTCQARAASWCVANPAVGDNRLQVALDFACGQGQGQGMVDCSAIKPGGRCFNPDTEVAHASYAFNDYYQQHGRTDQSCDFGGCGSVVHQQPAACSDGGLKWWLGRPPKHEAVKNKN